MMKTQRLLTALVLFGALGCGDDENRRPPGGGSDGGSESDAMTVVDAAMGTPDADISPEGPLITVLEPAEPTAGDYSAEAIVTTRTLVVRCRVEPNGDVPVDGSSVIAFASSGGVSVENGAAPTGVVAEYEALLNLASLPTGMLTVGCRANDLSNDALTGEDSIGTFLDLGPNVAVSAPIAGSSFSGGMQVVFSASATPLGGDDALGALDTVELRVAGVTIDDVNVSGDLYSANIDFDDAAFGAGLNGPQSLQVRASNARGVTRSVTVPFEVDNSGPIISASAPTPGQLVAGVITISATVTDPNGVDSGSVVATISGVNEVELVGDGDVYSGFFDTRVLGSTVFPNVVIRARDVNGNQSSTGYIISLDNRPPVASLDSPPLREAKVEEGVLLCSHSFDPLGDDAVSDGQSVPQLFEVRARVEDVGNNGTQTSGIVVPKASVSTTGVSLYLLDDTSRPVVVDSNGDGFCDSINPQLIPSSVPSAANEVAVIDLAPINSTGESSYMGEGPVSFAATGNGECAPGDDTEAPEAVCVSTPLSRVIETPIEQAPAVYGVPPFLDLQCTGNGIDALATNISDGWACLALRAEDALGNAQVSAPVRICVDSDLSGDDGCPAVDTINLAGAPNCTGTYDPDTMMVTATPCTMPMVFPTGELRRTDL